MLENVTEICEDGKYKKIFKLSAFQRKSNLLKKRKIAIRKHNAIIAYLSIILNVKYK